MNAEHKDVIALLRSAVTGVAYPLSAEFDLEQVMPYIKSHHILPLVYEGARICGVESPLMMKLFTGYCKSMQISEGQMRELDRIYRAFEENGIDYMPLKGCRMKYLYPRPELRMMGDADVVIRLEQYDKIIPIMQQLGFDAIDDTDHELTWKSSGLRIELHKRLVPSHNKDYYSYYGNGWHLAKTHEGHYYRMTQEDEWVYEVTHFAKHFRDGGIGCRHVLDLWIYRKAHPDMDESYIEGEMKTLGLLDFYRNICRLTQFWFEDGPEDDVVALISDYIMASGSWGHLQERIRSVTIREQRHSAVAFNVKLVYFFHLLFPSAEMLSKKYTILQKAPWMLPVVWLIRPFYKILFEAKTLKKRKVEMQVLDKKSVDKQHELLKAMGIDYQF